MAGPVSAWVGDHLRSTKPEHALCGRLELVPSESWESKQACRVIHQHQPISMVSQCSLNAWLSSWLVEISADLWEVVAQ